MSKRRGFTLIELLIALLIAGIVITVVGKLTVNALHWGSWGFRESVIGEQFEQALDLIEEDVRLATDIDVAKLSQGRPLSETRMTWELHLWVADRASQRQRAQVSYRIGRSGNAVAQDSPPERPYPAMNLLRAQQDSTHSGANQPVVFYLNGPSEHPQGLQVYYYDRGGKPCSLAEDVYSVRVVLNGRTREGEVVSRARTIPLTAKYE